jgi:hypothetical protein
MLPSVLPSEGPAEKQRVGAALIHGKMRLAGLASPTTDGNTRNELYLWHYFGDPSMQMWGGEGLKILDPALFAAVFTQQLTIAPDGGDPPPYGVNVTLPPEFNGESFSLLRNGEVVGKGTGVNGVAQIPATFGDGSVKPGELVVVLDPDGGAPIRIPVNGIPSPTSPPPPPPPAEKKATSLTLDQPDNIGWTDTQQFTGSISPALAGEPIRIQLKKLNTQTVETFNTRTDSAGNYSVSHQFNDPGGSQYEVQAFFDGSDTHLASESPVRTFNQAGS